MYIVYLSDGTKHSAWRSKKEAIHQAEVIDGYRNTYIEYMEGLFLENGHYFV